MRANLEEWCLGANLRAQLVKSFAPYWQLDDSTDQAERFSA
jgi:hypothetical protein